MLNLRQKFVQYPWLAILAALLMGAIISFVITSDILYKQEKRLINSIRPVRLNSNDFKFINPLLGYSMPNVKEFNEFQPLNSDVSKYINSQTTNNPNAKISVYFRDLNMGRWIGINENEGYNPASMLKVVIMIAYYKESENNPEILSNMISYNKSLDEIIKDVPYQTPSTLEIGKKYTVNELIEKMIINSDNGAKNALLANVDNKALNDVYSDLGIKAPSDNDTNYTISAKAYSSFFRFLYNGSYLNQSLSEKALALLSKANFQDGLIAGVPKNIVVAQKFGEHISVDSDDKILNTQLHDCGIVYHPSRPYAICIMTQGDDLDTLKNQIKTISNIVYQSVDSNYKK